jgi:TfoX/Sxy family transcriptional regulator of competence genes
MFGYPAAFVGGNMFTALHEHRLIVRLPENARAELTFRGGTSFAPMGRPMREYLVVPPAMEPDRRALRTWMSRALDYAATLPKKKSAARRGPRKTTTRRGRA